MEEIDDTCSSVSVKPSIRYKFPQNCKVTINIELYKFSTSAMGKHAKYAIYGSDHLGDFESYRRYKEFKRLRDVLSASWIGTVVPMIPSKKAIGNLNKNFIEKRRKSLEYFIKQIAKVDHLYLSEHFQYFIRNSENFCKIAKDFHAPSFKDLSEIYQTVFFSTQTLAYSSPQLDFLLSIVQSCLKLLKSSKKCVKLCESTYEKYEKSHRNVLFSLKSITPIYFSDNLPAFTERSALKNPYSALASHLRLIILDLKSFELCIQKIKELKFSENTLKNKVKEYAEIIASCEQGKVPFIISTKSKIEVKENIIEVYKAIKCDQKGLQGMVEILFPMIIQENERFNKENWSMIAEALKEYAGLSVSEYENLAAYVLQVEESLNL